MIDSILLPAARALNADILLTLTEAWPRIGTSNAIGTFFCTEYLHQPASGIAIRKAMFVIGGAFRRLAA